MAKEEGEEKDTGKPVLRGGAGQADLPAEQMVMLLSKYADTYIDGLRFRSVCSSWRGEAEIPRESLSFPLLGLYDHTKTYYNDIIPDMCAYNRRVFFVHDSSHKETTCWPCKPRGWFVEIDGSSPRKIRWVLPKPGPREFNILEHRVSLLHEHYYDGRELTLREKTEKGYSLHLISTEKVAVIPTSKGLVALLIHDHRKNLALFKHGEAKWSPLDVVGDSGGDYTDIVTYKGHFYALQIRQNRNRVVEIDSMGNVTAFENPPVTNINNQKPSMEDRMLVASGVGLLLLRKYYLNRYNTNHEAVDQRTKILFKVYKLDAVLHEWVELNSLGDLTVLQFQTLAFAAPAKDLPGFDGNCIYFLKHEIFHKSSTIPVHPAPYKLKDGGWLEIESKFRV
ncbi:hypothetical protein Tsubulata_021420 [Turnera subulata]|uniref:KIB1-4 beta-propeller domain-containing protein n=1 Tax=Turnera subulata TaxID=218843 RepID=A0A9Q0G6S0_9ROSI|nr:hypothetical protein Tsubulata_021420 [Turnera subulata]